MRFTLVVHVAAGALALLAGYAALFAPKGAPLHRRVGRAFVYAMLTMAVGGTLLAVLDGVEPALNVPAAVMSAYLVLTAFTTVTPPYRGSAWLQRVATLVALVTGLVCLRFGIEAVTSVDGTRHGMPAFPFFMFGSVGLLGSALDLRMMRAGGLRGVARIRRHLWRMCFALFIAAMAFFLGQSDEFPQAIRMPALLALPVVTVLVTMIYWLWRTRRRARTQRTFMVREAA